MLVLIVGIVVFIVYSPSVSLSRSITKLMPQSSKFGESWIVVATLDAPLKP